MIALIALTATVTWGSLPFMPKSAYRYRWERPEGGFDVFELRWRMGGRGVKPVDPPREVIAPKQLAAAAHEVFEPKPEKRAMLVRELDLLDPSDNRALVAYMTRWGFLQGSTEVSRASWRHIRHTFTFELAACFAAPDAPLLGEPQLPKNEELVPYVHVTSARRLVRTYQDAVARYADLPRLRGDTRRAERKTLRKLVLDELGLWSGVERDPETFLPLIRSPLATAWQRLAEASVGGQVPQRCAWCQKPFSLAETDRRPDRPVKFCCSSHRSKAWQEARKKSPKKKALQRRGRS